jgi:hypothetical protein
LESTPEMDLSFADVNKHSRKPIGQTIMDNLETWATLTTQDSERRQTKLKTHNTTHTHTQLQKKTSNV